MAFSVERTKHMDWTEFSAVAIQTLMFTLTLTFMLVGLFGLLIPIFPGIAVMWLAVLIYAIVQAILGTMTVWDWVLFAIITVLAAFGGVVDNIIIAGWLRKTGTPWSNIIISSVLTLVASFFVTPILALLIAPLILYFLEYRRLQDRQLAFEATKAWLAGFSWTFVALFAIGLVMIGLWLAWVLV